MLPAGQQRPFEIVGQDVVATFDDGERPRGFEQSQGAARTHPQLELRGGTQAGGEAAEVLQQIFGDENVATGAAQEERFLPLEHLARQRFVTETKLALHRPAVDPAGQNYTPVDKDQVMYYREDKAGQVLQEGINEPGGMSSWMAAATSYSTSNRIMVPFYVYYSMFGFQRFGDLAWAAGDMLARGFLLGGTSGRTTLNGEGLQHEDGHSHVLAGTIPNCIGL